MRQVDRSEYEIYFEKARQHENVAKFAYDDKSNDAAITNFCIAIINCLDALSVNRFGKDLSSSNHEAAPILLHQHLNGIGITDFKTLAGECTKVLKMKNVASYRSLPLTSKDAKLAKQTLDKVKVYARSNLDRAILPG